MAYSDLTHQAGSICHLDSSGKSVIIGVFLVQSKKRDPCAYFPPSSAISPICSSEVGPCGGCVLKLSTKSIKKTREGTASPVGRGCPLDLVEMQFGIIFLNICFFVLNYYSKFSCQIQI